jgi:S-formylglutathione hydrolase FrmB
MKFGRGTLIFVIAASLASFSQAPASKGSIPKSKIVQLKVKSPEKDFPIRSVYVMTPAVPANQVALLPVVYMLHGWPGSPSGLIAGVEEPLESAFANGAAPFIAVFPDGNALTHSDSEWADSYDGRAKIETWLTTAVIKTVEAGNVRSGADRAILGFSMGGYGAAIIGLHHPELFGQVVTLAGYFVLDDLTNAFGLGVETDAKHKYQNPLTFLKVANKARWFLGESHDDYTPLIRGQAAAWAAKLKTVKATYATSYAPGGHSYVFVTNEIPGLLKWFKWGTVTPPLKAATPLPSNSQSSSPIPSPKPSVHSIFN